ncbi:heavy metal-associated domain-containing protein [Micromonospora sp. NPDC050200]|uniref:heavy-metal-associated domain-containing protein n=1 Tax=Micromonospora sp. NPDC050200 TaxID=3155664 RepID=UPI0033DF5E7B
MCTSATSCGCATATDDNTPAAVGNADGLQSTYTISGMTCTGCARKVASHLGAVPGVTDVQVDVANGTATVTSEVSLDRADVHAAVERAGYRLVS